jgi:DNA-directed RNA polymerase subunit E'/Rpb7
MKDTCNGTVTVSTMPDYEYNVIVEDENGGQYAEIRFMLVYFNPETEKVLNSYFD